MLIKFVILLVLIVLELGLFFFFLFNKKRKGWFKLIASLLSLILVVVTTWILLFPKIPVISPTGKYKVGYIETWYKDTNRIETYTNNSSNRELPVAFWYPLEKKDSKCSLVIFSHGSLGVKESNLTLYNELASLGYVVVAVDHTYQSFSSILSDGKKIGISRQFLQELSKDEPNKNPTESLKNFNKWMNIRMNDLNFVLDYIKDKIKEESNELSVYNIINDNSIIAMGHSLGGSAALGLGRIRDDVVAVVALESPFMYDIKGVNENNEFIFDEEEYPVPMLNIYSDSSWNNLRKWKQYKQNVKYLNLESDKYQNIHIEGIGHMALTDFSLTSPFLTMCMDGVLAKPSNQEILKRINEIIVAFLDKEIKIEK